MTPLSLMIAVVEQHIYLKKGKLVTIRIETHKDLQLLGIAYDFITQPRRRAST